MFFGAILEVAIGLVFTWLVLSATTMQLQEWVGSWFNWRSVNLEEAIRDMFKNEALAEQFYNHPFIQDLGEKDKKGNFIKPTFIPNSVFAAAAFDVVLNAWKTGKEIPAESLSIAHMRNSIHELEKEVPELGRMLKHLLGGINQKGAKTEKMMVEGRINIEGWFDQVMNETSRHFKKKAQKWALIFGIVITIVFNIDSINITNKLWQEPTIRQALVAQAGNFTASADAPNITEIPGYFSSLAIPVGWLTVPAKDQTVCKNLVNILEDGRFAFKSGSNCGLLINVPLASDIWGWFLKLLGLGISSVAAMQGAPLWFDLLKKLIGLRTPTASSSAPQSK